MKLIVDNERDRVILTVQTTGDETKEIDFPKDNLHYWYPFNVNFSYKYTNSKKFIYLVAEEASTVTNFYNTKILKKTKPLEKKGGYPFNSEVFQRNMYIIRLAEKLGLPTIDRPYSLNKVKEGFKLLQKYLKILKSRIERRVIENSDEVLFPPEVASEDWDRLVYNNATQAEKEALIEFGEMYVMLGLMRKLAE